MNDGNRPIIDTATMCEFIFRGILEMKGANDGTEHHSERRASEAQDLHDGKREVCAA